MNNLVGSTNLINLSVKHNVKRFVFTSSVAAYGNLPSPMTEAMTPMPEDPYGIAKYAVELDLKAAYHMWGMEYTIFRPHNVYGERQHHGDTYRNVLGIFMNQVFMGKPMTIFGDGKQTRAFSYIDDVAPYIAKSCEMDDCVNEIINIGADKPCTVLEIAELIQKEMGIEAKIEFLPERNEVKHAYCDHEKAQRIFGIDTITPLEEGVKKMIASAKEIGFMEPTKFNGIELWDKMPESWRKFTQ
jgi:UDP-glucose 4-epimerase